MINLVGDIAAYNFGVLGISLNLSALPPASSDLVGRCDVALNLEGTGFVSVIVGTLNLDIELNAIPSLSGSAGGSGTGEDCLTANDSLPVPSTAVKNRWFI